MKKCQRFLSFFLCFSLLLLLFTMSAVQSNADTIVPRQEFNEDNLLRPQYTFDSITLEYGEFNSTSPVISHSVFSSNLNYDSSSTQFTNLITDLGNQNAVHYSLYETTSSPSSGNSSVITYSIPSFSDGSYPRICNSFRVGTGSDTRYHYRIVFTFYNIILDYAELSSYPIDFYITGINGTSYNIVKEFYYSYLDYSSLSFSSVSHTEQTDPGNYSSLLPSSEYLKILSNDASIVVLSRLTTIIDITQLAEFQVFSFNVRTNFYDGVTYLSNVNSIVSRAFPVLDYGIGDASQLGSSLLRGASNFLQVEIFPGFSFLSLLFMIVAIPILIWIFKLFLGG